MFSGLSGSSESHRQERLHQKGDAGVLCCSLVIYMTTLREVVQMEGTTVGSMVSVS